MFISAITRILAALIVLGLMAGCGGGPVLSPVKGKVSYRGAPLSGGTIVFTPDANRGGHGPLASADIQPDGSYTLHSGAAPGAAVGWHRVTIVAVEKSPTIAVGQRFHVPRSLIPEKYRDPELSGLSCEIKPNKENGINFNLE